MEDKHKYPGNASRWTSNAPFVHVVKRAIPEPVGRDRSNLKVDRQGRAAERPRFDVLSTSVEPVVAAPSFTEVKQPQKASIIRLVLDQGQAVVGRAQTVVAQQVLPQYERVKPRVDQLSLLAKTKIEQLGQTRAAELVKVVQVHVVQYLAVKVQPAVEWLRPKLDKHTSKIDRGHAVIQHKLFLAGYRLALALCILATFVQAAEPVVNAKTRDVLYNISPGVESLIGQGAKELQDKLIFNGQQEAYIYNENYSPPTGTINTNNGAYQATLSTDASKGITVTDPMARINIKLVPQFKTSIGKEQEGRVIYPLDNTYGAQMIYTLKGSGLKEDLVLTQKIADTMSFSYKATLPEGVVLKMLPSGDIGVYSGDPTLFGNISFGSDADRARVSKARARSPKNNLVFAIPAPVIKETGRTTPAGRAKFSLKGSTITVSATNLNHSSYPLSIDPTITVASAAGFNQGYFDDNVDTFDSAGRLGRGAITGGAPQANADQTVLPTAVWASCTVAYNGYIYIAGGRNNGTAQTAVRYNTINSTTGAIGATWSTTNITAFPQTRWQHSCVISNGVFYAIGGNVNGGTTGSTSVIYNTISKSDGTIRGSWTSTGTLTAAIYGMAAAVYNGRLYVSGGADGSSPKTTVQSSLISGDNSLPNFSTTNMTALPVSREGHGMVFANDHAYIFGGDNDGSTFYATAYYASVNTSTGAIGTWTSTSALPAARSQFSFASFNGYIYVSAGCSGYGGGFNPICNSSETTHYYTAINADGSLAGWRTANDSGGTSRFAPAGLIVPAASNTTNAAFFYTTGGCTAVLLGACTATSTQVGMSIIMTAGWNAPFSESTGSGAGHDLGTARYAHGVVAYNGWLYAIGGCGSGNCGSVLATTEKVAIGSDGSVGTWAADNNLNVGVIGVSNSTYVYNGYIYVVGGCITATAVLSCTVATNGVQVGTISMTTGAVTWATIDLTHAINQSVLNGMAVVHNGYLYAMGGIPVGGSASTDVQYAPLSPTTGAITANFSPVSGAGSTPQFSAGITNGSAAVYDKYVYVFYNSTQPIYSTLSYSGGNGSWSNTTGTLPATMQNGAAFANKGYVYFGNGRDSNPTSTLYIGKINLATGDVATFSTINGVATARSFPGMVAYRDYIYVVGGCQAGVCTTVSVKTNWAKIENGGSAGGTYTNDTASSAFVAHAYHTTAVVGGYMYIIGGCAAGSASACNPTTTVHSALINADTGALGSWTTTTSLADSRKEQGGFVYGGKIYVLGGCNNGNCNSYVPSSHTIEIGTPNGSGGITWAYNANALPNNAVKDTNYVAFDGYVYQVGGVLSGTTQSAVTYAAITSGTISATWTSTSSLNTARSFNGVLAYNGYIYAVGGQNSTPGDEATIEVAKIQSDHSLSAGWTVLSTRIPRARYAFTSDILNGMLVIAGGRLTAGTIVSNVDAAPINSDGSLGDFSGVGTLATARSDTSGSIYNGRIYATGGVNGSGNTIASADRGSLELQPRTGHFSKRADTDIDTNPINFVYRGSLYNAVNLPLSFTYTMSTSASPAFVTYATQAGIIPETVYTITPISGGVSRYYWFRFTFDDSQNSVFPDVDNRTFMNNYDMYFHAGTNASGSRRLRNGKTFTNEVQNNLDAHP